MKIDGKLWEPDKIYGFLFGEVVEGIVRRTTHKDGVGLRLELTEHEEYLFKQVLRNGLATSLLNMIVEDLDRLGRKHPELRSTYENRVFQVFVERMKGKKR